MTGTVRELIMAEAGRLWQDKTSRFVRVKVIHYLISSLDPCTGDLTWLLLRNAGRGSGIQIKRGAW